MFAESCQENSCDLGPWVFSGKLSGLAHEALSRKLWYHRPIGPAHVGPVGPLGLMPSLISALGKPKDKDMVYAFDILVTQTGPKEIQHILNIISVSGISFPGAS